MREIERVARDYELAYLQMDLSVTAEPFYLHQDYSVLWRGQSIGTFETIELHEPESGFGRITDLLRRPHFGR